jgi:hypothetical protein
MYTYADGWMRQWREEGDLRVRFAPKPICEQWWPGIREWIKLDPGTLWMDEVEAFRARRRKPRQRQNAQLLLPGIDMEQSYSLSPKQDPGASADQLWKALPERWWSLLRPIRVYPWRCINFLQETEAAGEDLFASNPGLAWLLACTYISGGPLVRAEGIRRIKKGLPLSQRNQLELLQLPQAKWMVNMLRRLEMDMNPVDCLRLLRLLDREPHVRQSFQHVNTLPSRAFYLMNPKTLNVLTAPLIREVVDGTVPHHELARVRENLTTYGTLVWRGEKVPRFSSNAEIDQWLRKRESKMEDISMIMQRNSDHYPAPPFTGTDRIIPILTHARLIQEGRQMHHCVATHHDQINNGNMVVFEVTHPERATLALRWTPLDFWRVFDFRLKFNRNPSVETWAYVRQWLNLNGVRS